MGVTFPGSSLSRIHPETIPQPFACCLNSRGYVRSSDQHCTNHFVLIIGSLSSPPYIIAVVSQIPDLSIPQVVAMWIPEPFPFPVSHRLDYCSPRTHCKVIYSPPNPLRCDHYAIAVPTRTTYSRYHGNIRGLRMPRGGSRMCREASPPDYMIQEYSFGSITSRKL